MSLKPNDMPPNPLVTGTLSDEKEALKKALIKVSFAGTGIDKKLDAALEQLRATIKKTPDITAIQAKVDAIADVLREIGDDAGVHKGIPVSELLAGFQKQRLPANVLLSLAAINQKTHEPVYLAEAISQAFQAVPDAEASPSLLSRLFSGKPTDGRHAGAVDSESAVATVLPDIDSSVAEPLLRLLDGLELPDEREQDAREIRERLLALKHWEELPEVMEAFSALVLHANDAGQAQFENFLQQINTRLASVEDYLSAQGARSQASLNDTHQLDQDVRSHVQLMHDDVKDVNDLADLQGKISSRLDGIVKSVDKFRTQQVQRSTQGEEEARRLREQLRASEAEADQLREALREQRARAATDALTQLPNRHAYHDRLQQEYTRWKRYHNKLALIICDIDHFKRVNDKHGHAAGDMVIKSVGQILRAGLRETDFLSRFGGEEFVLLMPETNLIDATKATNKLRQRIANVGVTYKGSTILVTTSFGVAEFEGDDVPRDALERADRALYRAKNKGRNQVCCERKHIVAGEDEHGTVTT